MIPTIGVLSGLVQSMALIYDTLCCLLLFGIIVALLVLNHDKIHTLFKAGDSELSNTPPRDSSPAVLPSPVQESATQCDIDFDDVKIDPRCQAWLREERSKVVYETERACLQVCRSNQKATEDRMKSKYHKDRDHLVSLNIEYTEEKAKRNQLQGDATQLTFRSSALEAKCLELEEEKKRREIEHGEALQNLRDFAEQQHVRILQEFQEMYESSQIPSSVQCPQGYVGTDQGYLNPPQDLHPLKFYSDDMIREEFNRRTRSANAEFADVIGSTEEFMDLDMDVPMDVDMDIDMDIDIDPPLAACSPSFSTVDSDKLAPPARRTSKTRKALEEAQARIEKLEKSLDESVENGMAADINLMMVEEDARRAEADAQQRLREELKKNEKAEACINELKIRLNIPAEENQQRAEDAQAQGQTLTVELKKTEEAQAHRKKLKPHLEKKLVHATTEAAMLKRKTKAKDRRKPKSVALSQDVSIIIDLQNVKKELEGKISELSRQGERLCIYIKLIQRENKSLRDQVKELDDQVRNLQPVELVTEIDLPDYEDYEEVSRQVPGHVSAQEADQIALDLNKL
ncbi:hypothetical protein N7486_006407 [Penicillium sp. IBT 16267x]|nr:hypothetical protein N7486_006407 [Penicillium sp. IBT 16267x]